MSMHDELLLPITFIFLQTKTELIWMDSRKRVGERETNWRDFFACQSRSVLKEKKYSKQETIISIIGQSGIIGENNF